MMSAREPRMMSAREQRMMSAREQSMMSAREQRMMSARERHAMRSPYSAGMDEWFYGKPRRKKHHWRAPGVNSAPVAGGKCS